MQTALYTVQQTPYDLTVVKVCKRSGKEGAELRFYLSYRYDKKTWRIFSDQAGNPFSSERVARKLAAVIDYELADKAHNPYKYQPSTNKLWLFKNQIMIWLNDKRKVNKPSTIASYESYIRLYITPFFGAMDVSEIKAYHGAEFIKTLPGGMAPVCKVAIISILNAFFRHCSRMEMIPKPPAMPKIQVPERAKRWADYETQQRILAQIPKKHQPLFHFAMRHGMRIGEVRGLMVKDIDFQRSTITVQRQLAYYGVSSTKTGRVRVLPLHPELVDTVFGLCYKQLPDSFVFKVRGKPYSHPTIYKVAMAAIRAEGLEKLTPYELFRHSVLTQAAVRGINLTLIQQYAGHASINTTRQYVDMTALNITSVQSMAPVVDLFKKEEKK